MYQCYIVNFSRFTRVNSRVHDQTIPTSHMSAMDGLLKALGAPPSPTTKEEASNEKRAQGSDKEKYKEKVDGGKEKPKEGEDEKDEVEEGDEGNEKGEKYTPSLESRQVDIDRVRATGADVDAAKKEEKAATAALEKCTAVTQRCVAAYASAKERLASTNNILRLAALERRADILRQLESADAAVAVFDPDPATPSVAPSVLLAHQFPVEPSCARSTRPPTPPVTMTFQAQQNSDSESTSKNFPTISSDPSANRVASDTNDPVASSTPPTMPPASPVFSATLPVALAQSMPHVASAFDCGTTAHTPPLKPTSTVLAFELIDLRFFNATLDQIRQAEGIDRQDSEDVSCAAKVLLRYFPDHCDSPTAVTVATAVDRAAKDPSSAYISATNTLLLALRGFHAPEAPGARHSWGHTQNGIAFATTPLHDQGTVGSTTPQPPPPEHFDIEEITAHRMTRVDGFTVVAYKVRWVGDVRASWEQELRLQHFRTHITRYWCGTPKKDNKIKKMSPGYHQKRIDAAQRESSRSKCGFVLAPGFAITPRYLWLQKFAASALPKGTSFWYKAHDGLWWLGEIAYREPSDKSSLDSLYIGGFIDRAGPVKVNLQPGRYAPSPTPNAKCGAWCLQCPKP